MTVYFVGLSKNRAVRKAMDFWYKNFRNFKVLKDFFSYCSLVKRGVEFIVVYRGPKPPAR